MTKVKFDKILGLEREEDSSSWNDLKDKPSNIMIGTGTSGQISSFTGTGGATIPIDVEEIPYGFNLSAYSNQAYQYDLTATTAAVTFNTTALQVALNRAGSWKLSAGLVLEYSGATFAANQTAIAKLRRTNNTAADITNSNTPALTLDIVTTRTGLICVVNLPIVVYSTVNTNDIIQMFANLSALPSAGAVKVKSAWILAEFLY